MRAPGMHETLLDLQVRTRMTCALARTFAPEIVEATAKCEAAVDDVIETLQNDFHDARERLERERASRKRLRAAQISFVEEKE